MRYVIIAALILTWVGYQHLGSAKENAVLEKGRISECVYRDSGAFACLADLYGTAAVGECAVYLSDARAPEDDMELLVRGKPTRTVETAFVDCLTGRL